MAQYRYSVVIEVGIDASGISNTQADQKIKQELSKYERQVAESEKRVADTRVGSTKRSNDAISRIHEETIGNQISANERYNASIIDGFLKTGQARNAQATKDLKVQEKLNSDILRANQQREKEQMAISNAEAKRQQKITDDMLAYNVTMAKRRTKEDEKIADELIANAVKEQNARNKAFADQAAYEKQVNRERVRDAIDSAKRRVEETAKIEKQDRDLQDKIRRSDPFSNNPSTKASNVRGVITDPVYGGRLSEPDAMQRIKALDPFQSASNRNLQQSAQDLDKFNKKVIEGSEKYGVWEKAFRGAFVGAVAGLSFALLISGIVGVTQAMANLIIESVKLAATLETRTQAISVFTGSTRLAKQELEALDEVARNTAGLRLEQAEAGYQKLRGLGFEAQQSRAFIKELGEEKLLSGASDEALERIIFNFSQIASGGQKVSQELREIFTQMPTLRNAFFDAFQTLDPKKIQSFFDNDTKGAFKQLTDAMEKQKAANGGLENSLGKLADEFVLAGRLLGEPLLEPLTKDTQMLTTYLRESTEAVRDFGIEIADTYNGVRQLVGVFSMLYELNSKAGLINALPDGVLIRNSLSAATFGLSEFAYAANDLGEIERKNKETQRFNSKAQEIFNSDNTVNFGNLSGINLTDEEKKAVALQKERDAQMLRDKAQAQQIVRTEQMFEEVESITKNAFERQRALLDFHLRYTTKEELDYQKSLRGMKAKELEAQIANTRQYYAQQIELADGDQVTITKLTLEGNQKLRDIKTQGFTEELANAKRQAELEYQIWEELRQAKIETKELEIREINTLNERQNKELERFISLNGQTDVSAFQDQIDLTERQTSELIRITRESYALQLEDRKLSSEQIVNLTRQMNLEIGDLEETKRQRVLDIQDALYAQQQQNLENSFKNQVDFLQSNLERVNFGGSLLNSFGSNSSALLQQALTGTTLTNLQYQTVSSLQLQQDIDKSSLREKMLSKASLLTGGDTQAVKDTDAEIDKLNDSIALASRRMIGWRDEIEPTTLVIAELVEKLKKGKGQIADIDNLEIESLKKRQRLEADLLKSETEFLDKSIENAKNDGRSNEVRELSLRKLNVESKQKLQNLQQEAELIALIDTQAQGLRATLARLQSGDKTTLLFLNRDFEQNLLKEQITSWQQIYKLRYDVLNLPTIDNLAIEQASLEKILEIRSRETDAIIRSNDAQAELNEKLVFSQTESDARLLEFLASQKGITDILSDARINAITAVYDRLDTAIGSLTKRFGLFGDVIKEVLSNLIKLALNRVFMKMFGLDPSGASSGGKSSGGGFNIFGGGGQGGGFGGFGGGGFGGTPNFNPNAIGGAFNPPTSFNRDTDGFGLGQIGLSGEASQIRGFDGKIISGASGSGGVLKGLQGLLPALGGSLGASLGGTSAGGQILGGVGGSLLGLVGGAFGSSSTAFGGAFGSIGGFLGISGAATLGIGAAIGGALLLGSYLIGKNAQRRKDEKSRNSAMIDALSALDKLLADVNNDKIDGQSALAQADQIRASYVESMGQLKDKKTRNIALKDVSRLDSKIGDIKAAVQQQTNRQERLSLLVPTFAGGGAIMPKSHRGLVVGHGTETSDSMMGYSQESDTPYRVSNREFVLDAETTKHIGTRELYKMLQSKGRSYRPTPNGYATGGTITATPSTAPNVSASSSSNSTMGLNAEITIVNQIGAEQIAEVVSSVVKEYSGSDAQVNALAKKFKDDDMNELIAFIQKKLGK